MDVSTVQGQIAALAKRYPNRGLTSLNKYLDREWIREAFRRIRKNGAVGIDGVSVEEYAKELLATSLGRIRLCLDTVNPRVFTHIRRGGIFEEVVGNIRRFLELSVGHDIRVEIQKMITLPTAHETVEDFDKALSKVKPGDVVSIQAVRPDGAGGLQHRFFNMTVPERE